jgi:plastocyanin
MDKFSMLERFLSRFREVLLIACLAVVLLLSACATSPSSGGNIAVPTAEPTMVMPTQTSANPSSSTLSVIPVTGPKVTISNFTFGPDSLTVPVGTSVTWVNQDDIPHTVNSVDKLFASQALDTGDQFTYKFTTAGIYSYFCSLHPKMVGKIIVK